MKHLIYIITIIFGFTACDSMDDNYKDYLKDIPKYSPRVTNLNAVSSFQTVDLTWDNPAGNIAKKIMIDTQDTVLIIDEMVNHYKLENLEVKGYEISVYTIDAYGNSSIPTTIPAFPKADEL